jgi:chromosome segregation ATPase
MGFENKAEIADLETQRQNLTDEIQRLGVKIEEAQVQAAQVQDLSAQIEALGQQVTTANAELAALNEELQATQNEVTMASSQLSLAQRELQNTQAELVVVNADVAAAAEALAGKHAKLVEAHTAHEKIEADFALEFGAHTQKLAALDTSIEAATNGLSSTSAALEAEQQKLVLAKEELVLANSQLTSLKGSIADAQQEHQAVLADVETAKGKLSEVAQAAAALKEEADTYFLHKQHEAIEKEKVLVAREGEVSVKESLLEKKAENLRVTKASLEEHFNRPINNIII